MKRTRELVDINVRSYWLSNKRSKRYYCSVDKCTKGGDDVYHIASGAIVYHTTGAPKGDRRGGLILFSQIVIY